MQAEIHHDLIVTTVTAQPSPSLVHLQVALHVPRRYYIKRAFIDETSATGLTRLRNYYGEALVMPGNSSADVLAHARSTLAVASCLAPLIPVPIVASIFMTAQAIVGEAEVGDLD